MYGIGLQLTSTTIIGGSYSPTSLFAANEPGVWFDNNDAANLNWRYNFATGSALPGNAAYWNNSGTANGVTVSTSGFGTGIDGLPFIDYSVTGTATANTFLTVYGDVGTSTRVPATTGQTYTTSFFAQVVGGVEPPALCGVRADVIGETSPSSFVEQGNTITAAPIVETLISQTYTFANAATNQARCAIVIRTQSGVTVNYTLRIKAVQFERNFVRTTYQPITDVTTEVRARFPNATLYQDTAGTLPVTTPGQSVALALDKSKGLALGAELVTNGDFSSATGWTTQAGWSISGGLLVGNVAAAAFTNAFSTVAPAVGKAYQVTYTITSLTSGAVRAAFFGGTAVLGAVRSAVGTYTELFIALTGNASVGIQAQGAGFVGTIDNITVRELAGNHATQATAASRPLYALLPANGLRNLANGSASVGDVAFWPTAPVLNGVTATKVASGFDTDGLPYVDIRFQGTSSGTFQDAIYASTTFSRTSTTAGQQWTASAICSQIGGSLTGVNGCRAKVVEETAPSTYIGQANGANVATSTPTTSSATLTVATGNQVRPAVELSMTSGATIDVTYRVKGLQFELGSTRTAYQFNYSNVNIAQPPFTQVGALLYDGVDDFMATPAINFESYTWDGQARRNFALGSAQPANDAFWVSSSVSGGVTVTRVGTGVEADGQAYADYAVSGTASASAFQSITVSTSMRTPVTAGQTWANSFVFRLVGGVSPPANCGPRAETYGESIIPSTTESFFFGAQQPIVTDRTQTLTASFVNALTVTGRPNIIIRTEIGATVNYTVRIKGFQFEQGIVRTAWQGTGTDKVSIFAGVRKTSDAGQAVVAELTTSFGANNGAFSLQAPSGAAVQNYLFNTRGTTAGTAGPGSGFPSPDTAVLTGIGDIAGDVSTLRRNGAQIATNAADQGTGNYANAPIYFGARAGTSLFFRGYMYEIIARGALTEANLLARTETSINQQTGAY